MNTGRVVVITGASGGVGSALVHAFLANDELVVATAWCGRPPGAKPAAPQSMTTSSSAEDRPVGILLYQMIRPRRVAL